MSRDTFYVYIATNKANTVLYTGVTNDLRRRVWAHREGIVKGFTKRYNVRKLVYFEQYGDPRTAIAREKQIKAGSRKNKEDLVDSVNPERKDLWDDL